MNVTRFSHCVRLSLAAGIMTLAASCSSKVSGTGATINKVNTYHLQTVGGKPVADPSVSFERSYRLHGAISPVEQQARLGNYLTVFWKVSDRSEPVTVRLEYRQTNSGLAVKTVEQQVSPGRTNTTEFAFVGDDYVLNGPITSWRASLLRGKDVLVSYDSYLWQ